MRKVAFLLLYLSFTLLFASAQKKGDKKNVNIYANIDYLALQMPDSVTTTPDGIAAYVKANFQQDIAKARAIFIWIASNIEYDIDNMFAINFYEKKKQKISKPLRTRKGICENYAELFNAVCEKAGLKSYVIEGYTKQNGFTDYIPHAWCAAKIDSAWYMFDPTWGSGYVHNSRFYKQINNDYFKTQPAVLIKSHMPFDYLWQFLNYPVTNQEFYEGKVQQERSKPYFNFEDSILVFEKQSETERLAAITYRVEKNGVKNSMIFDRLQHLKIEIENIRQTETMNLFNSAANDYNAGINDLNEFIQYRNKQFTPVRTDSEIQNMLDSVDYKLKSARTKVRNIKDPDGKIIDMMIQLNKSIDDASIHLQEQQDWLNKYLKKPKAERKFMFYTKIKKF